MSVWEREGKKERWREKEMVKDEEKEEDREMCGCPSCTLESWWVDWVSAGDGERRSWVCVWVCACLREGGTWKEYPKKKIVPTSSFFSSPRLHPLLLLLLLILLLQLVSPVCVSSDHTHAHTLVITLGIICCLWGHLWANAVLTNIILQTVFAKWLSVTSRTGYKSEWVSEFIMERVDACVYFAELVVCVRKVDTD